MTEYASPEDLTAGDLGDGVDLDLPSGKRIRVRGLSRHELMFNGKGTEDQAVMEARNVHSCLIQPKMTIKQVEQWQRNSLAGGDFRVVSEAIRDLSKLGKGADKSDVRTVGDTA